MMRHHETPCTTNHFARLLARFFASGCVYKMNIQQGNYLVADSVSQLKEGMTRSQVRFLLGTPMVPDAFDDDRWDYYYFFSSQQVQGAAQAPPDGLFRGRQGAALSKTRAFRPRPTSTSSSSDLQQGHRGEQEASASRAAGSALFERDTPASRRLRASSCDRREKADEKPPDPVPPSEPLPAPAGTPSGPP